LFAKWLKTSKLEKSIGSAHNLKVTGSNPVPATKKTHVIKYFKAEHDARLLSFAVYINATSTRHQKNRTSTHKHAVAGSGRQLAVARNSGSRHHQPVVLSTVD